jgi:hypothetical protein
MTDHQKSHVRHPVYRKPERKSEGDSGGKLCDRSTLDVFGVLNMLTDRISGGDIFEKPTIVE